MKKFLMLMTMLLLLSGCSRNQDDTKFYRHSVTYNEHLNTTTMVTFYYQDEINKDSIDVEIEAILKKADETYNVYNELSELSKVNRDAGSRTVTISDELLKSIEVSLELAEQTEGKFDPTVLPLADLWEINGATFYLGGNIPSAEAIESTLMNVDYKNIIIEGNEISFKEIRTKIDLGAVVKGTIAYDIATFLKAEGITTAIINVGSSSQYVFGNRLKEAGVDKEITYYKETTEPIRIGTANPELENEDVIFILNETNTGVSKTGIDQQYFTGNNKIYHHIFNTTTGYPVENNLLAVQVVSSNNLKIDAYSTMLYILGLEEGLKYVEEHDDLEAIFFTKDKEIYISSNIKNYQLVDKSFKIK